MVLVPCGELTGTDAGGEIEDEADSGLKIEVWNVRGLAGESLVLLVDGEVAARFTVDAFENGRFYAQGYHVTGEMGGILT